jgi:MFS family permease
MAAMKQENARSVVQDSSQDSIAPSINIDPEEAKSAIECISETLPPPYSVFTRYQKVAIVSIAGLTGLLSPLSSTLYVPAIPTITIELDISIAQVNFTITSYLILQGIAPTIWGPISDSLGRRQLYIASLSVYIGACIGLSISNSYPAILVLRALQAAGSASTTALGAGLIGDLIHVSKRGGYMGNYSALGGFGTAIGPVLGGIFAQYTGWHGIFFFLLGLSASMLLIVVLLVPETLRSIVGNGSVPSPRCLRTLLPGLRPPRVPEERNTLAAKRKVDILAPIYLLAEPDVICSLAFTGICFMVWQMGIVAAARLYDTEYHLSQLAIGLTYISNGMGSLCGSMLTGRILNQDYKKQLRREAGGSEPAPGAEVVEIERARILGLRLPTALYIISVVGFGWAVQSRVHVSVPIILGFFMGGLDTMILATFCKFPVSQIPPGVTRLILGAAATLIVDLFTSSASSASSSVNLARCTLAALGSATIEPLIQAVRPGWAFTILGALCLVSCGFAWAELKRGRSWRERRANRMKEA